MTDNSMLTVPISKAQFEQLDILLATLPGVKVIAITIDDKRRECTFVLGKPVIHSTIPLYILREITQTMRANLEYGKACSCPPGGTCPDCIASHTYQVYAWAINHII
jgi:hypothetical protein